MSLLENVTAQITALMTQANLPGHIQSVTPCALSGNNRTYRVDTSHGVLAAKKYFRHEEDKRDRLGNEFKFLTYAAQSAPGMAPMPLAVDHSNGLGLYEFFDGEPVLANDVDWNQVQNAADFFLSLNSPTFRAQAEALPDAAEACFSISEHLNLVSNRLVILTNQGPTRAENIEAHDLIQNVSAYWLKLSSQVLESAQSAYIDPNSLLAQEQRCVSPSDFGFHNALSTRGQTTRFLDFEYAGWDDPAKMTGDFFAQLAVPVPSQYFQRFVNVISTAFPDSERLIQRATLLRPVYQVKWFCIALNVFLPQNLARRKFADPTIDEIQFKRVQLAKAQTIFQFLAPI
jgi:hypothetical protein